MKGYRYTSPVPDTVRKAVALDLQGAQYRLALISPMLTRQPSE
jgi:hypothetical protein